MKPYRVLLTCWLITGATAVAGSILGNAGGSRMLFIGAVIGGIVGVAVAIAAVVRFGWLPGPEAPGALLGGLIGFALAAVIAVPNLHTPITPVASSLLVGIGALLGAGLARGWKRI